MKTRPMVRSSTLVMFVTMLVGQAGCAAADDEVGPESEAQAAVVDEAVERIVAMRASFASLQVEFKRDLLLNPDSARTYSESAAVSIGSNRAATCTIALLPQVGPAHSLGVMTVPKVPAGDIYAVSSPDRVYLERVEKGFQWSFPLANVADRAGAWLLLRCTNNANPTGPITPLNFESIAGALNSGSSVSLRSGGPATRP